jgi:predicted RNase H-like HicB family nuclease
MMWTHDHYAVLIEPLSKEEGGGFLAIVPDLPGCMSEGKTREEAARMIAGAISAWIEDAVRMGREVPEPSEHLAMAGE